MKTFTEYLQEASFAGRAWEGKLSKINELLDWFDKKKIMNATERKEYERIKRNYYRWHNDGDKPGILKKDIQFYTTNNDISSMLETKLEDFIKKILSKYQGKYNRSEFNIDKAINNLQEVIRLSDTSDEFVHIPHLIKDLKSMLNSEDEEVKSYIKQLEDVNTLLDKELEPIIPENMKTKVTGAKLSYVKKNKLTTLKLEKLIQKFDNIREDIILYCKELIEVYNKTKSKLK